MDGEFLPAAVSLPAAYNLYNAAAAVAAATALGINAKAARPLPRPHRERLRPHGAL